MANLTANFRMILIANSVLNNLYLHFNTIKIRDINNAIEISGRIKKSFLPNSIMYIVFSRMIYLYIEKLATINSCFS